GVDDEREVLGIHLAIACHHSDHIDANFYGDLVALGDGRADTEVLWLLDHGQPVPQSLLPFTATLKSRVGAAIVHHDDVVDELRHRLQHFADLALLVVAGD